MEMQSIEASNKGGATTKVGRNTTQSTSEVPPSIRLLLVVMKGKDMVGTKHDLISTSNFRSAISDEVKSYYCFPDIRTVTIEAFGRRIIVKSQVSNGGSYPERFLGDRSCYPGTHTFVQLGAEKGVPQTSYLLVSKEESRLERGVRGWWVDKIKDSKQVDCQAGIFINEGMPTNEAYVCFFIPGQGQKVHVHPRREAQWY